MIKAPADLLSGETLSTDETFQCVFTRQEGRQLSGASLVWVLISSTGAPPSCPSHYLKAQSPNTSHEVLSHELGIRQWD